MSKGDHAGPLSHVTVVLSRPSEPRNIGAACRAMKNSGLHRLAVVATGDAAPDKSSAKPLAHGAEEILADASVVADLGEIAESQSLVVGVTRRIGQKRKLSSFAPWELAEMVCARNDDIAVVFGNEQSGLSDAELQHCHVAVSIPASPEQPSLNLSHAVQVICYELYKQARLSLPRRTHVAMSAAQIHKTVSEITAALEELGFHTRSGPQGVPALLNDLLARASVSQREARRLRDLFLKLRGMHAR